MDSCVRGYQIYKENWPAPIGQFLECIPEDGNIHDPYCVAVILPDSNETVGHVPHRISAACRSFLRRNGSIICQVTGHRTPFSRLNTRWPRNSLPDDIQSTKERDRQSGTTPSRF